MQSQHNHHHGRSRRQTRASANHHNTHQKQMRALRLQQKEAEESAMLLEKVFAYRSHFEAARDFEMDDDEVFCPFNLMTEDDLSSMHSGSDRSSLSSGSPDQSPLQQQMQPAPALFLPPQSFSMNSFTNLSNAMSLPLIDEDKLHQPTARRVGSKAITIVDPSTGSVASPPPSVSPARQASRPVPAIALMSSHRVW